jgi:hypothetical protein
MDYIKNQAQEKADNKSAYDRIFRSMLSAIEVDLSEYRCVFGDDHSEGECANCENVRFGGSY